MKQIYYTQCPIGYGLGASNGFQIKRLTPGYPISGDFRHLGMRAFVGGTRTMAPPALRYRRVESGAAEVAWLQPRSHEYETERGLWGRPGGHFAHGLLLDEGEMETIANWPAGLHGGSLWTTTDPSPSRGDPPEPRELSPAHLRCEPDFASFAQLDVGDDADQLARLLTVIALAVREGRTLFLIDEPERNPDWIGFLTLAFPSQWRPAITFSTYHDRPEELPGFRIQGSTPAARTNRFALLSQGIVADLVAGVFEPTIEPARWARVLSSWLLRRSPADRSAWEATGRRARLARARCDGTVIWTDEWLDHLYDLEALKAENSPVPSSPVEWSALAETTRWAAELGLADELVPARPPGWWNAAGGGPPDERGALLAHLGQAGAWRGEDDARGWGETVARWVERLDPQLRARLGAAAVNAAPDASRPSFVRALVGTLPAIEAREILRRLESHPACDRGLLLPLSVREAVDDYVDRRAPDRLRSVLERAFRLSGVLPAVLDALAAEGQNRPASAEGLASLLAGALESVDRRRIAEFLRWGLRQGDGARGWLGTYLRRSFADPTNLEAWRSLAGIVPAKRQPDLARAVLEVGSDPNLPDEAFRWGVEEVLLPLPEAERPHDASWPGGYLDRNPSGLELLKRLFTKEYRKLGVKAWIEQARARGELSDAQKDRIDECERYARALRAGDARALLDVKLPAVPPAERGAMLAQILRHLGGSGDSFNLALETCRDAWPGAFGAGQEGLQGLGAALAEPLLADRGNPPTWFARMTGVLGRLGLTTSPGAGFEPGGLASEMVAATIRTDGPDFDRWRLRQALFDNDHAWRTLAADVRREIEGKPLAERLKDLAHWDHRIAKGMQSARFFELWLNVADGATLAAAVALRAADLKSLGSLPWWDSTEIEGASSDVRDRFARLSPMAPIAEDALPVVRSWIRPARRSDDHAADVNLPLLEDGAGSASVPSVSAAGLARWRCLEALSAIHREGLGAESCWQSQASWKHDLPLGRLDATDRYRFLAWFLARVDEFESFHVARLAKWLFECGVTDADRIARWHEELEPIAPVAHEVRIARSPLVSDLRVELKNVIRDARQPPRKSPSADSPERP